MGNWYLRTLTRGDAGPKWRISRDGIVIGRDSTCDVMLSDELVSRRHCKISVRGDGTWLEDLGSRNGSTVNGERVQRKRLAPNDEIGIGYAFFSVYAPDEDNAPTGDSIPIIGKNKRSREVPLGLVGCSESVQQVERLITMAAQSQLPVLIQGESGTGKELVAHLIHRRSALAKSPFVAANCAALHEELFESEVFGHEEGAFTGAVGRREGLMREACGGVLFLDEIGDLSERNQARLLRAIDTGRFRPVGASSDCDVDVRIISASNRDLRALTQEQRYRLDLYYRLNGMEIWIPPLRERIEDVQPLLEFYLAQFAADAGLRPPFLDDIVMDMLMSHPWQGNVRELRNVAARLVARGKEHPLPHDLTPMLTPTDPALESTGIRGIERMRIEHVLQEKKGNISAAARVLGIHRNTLRGKLDRYGIDPRRIGLG